MPSSVPLPEDTRGKVSLLSKSTLSIVLVSCMTFFHFMTEVAIRWSRFCAVHQELEFVSEIPEWVFVHVPSKRSASWLGTGLVLRYCPKEYKINGITEKSKPSRTEPVIGENGGLCRSLSEL
jgi:hypothetical protein